MGCFSSLLSQLKTNERTEDIRIKVYTILFDLLSVDLFLSCPDWSKASFPITEKYSTLSDVLSDLRRIL